MHVSHRAALCSTCLHAPVCHQTHRLPAGGQLVAPQALFDPRSATLSGLLDPQVHFPAQELAADELLLAALVRAGMRTKEDLQVGARGVWVWGWLLPAPLTPTAL